MQALQIRLRPDYTVLAAWLFLHAIACVVICLTSWPTGIKLAGLVYLALACVNGGRDLLLKKQDSILALRCSGGHWSLQTRCGEALDSSLVATLITGDWVWMQFCPEPYRYKLVLLTPNNTEPRNLRQLRVILRS